MGKSPFLEQVLYDNAIDFINKSMESYLNASDHDDKKEYKYAVLFLATGTELILKSILQNKHPMFVLRDIDSSDDKTVPAEKLITRIHRVYSDENKRIHNKDIENFNSIRQARNSIMHKDVRFDEPPEHMYARTLYSLDRIVKSFLNETLQDQVENWSLIIDSAVIRKEYYTNVEGYKIENIYIPCSLCSLEKLIPVKKDEDPLKCYHCNQKYDSVEDAIKSVEDVDLKEELFLAYTRNLIKNGDTISGCPDCGTPDYLRYDVDSNCLICFDCGIIRSEICVRCRKSSTYTYYDKDGSSTFCVNCKDNPLHNCDYCHSDEYNSAGSFKIDVRDKKRFEKVFFGKKLEGAFPVINLCQSCAKKLYRLQENEVLEIH